MPWGVGDKESLIMPPPKHGMCFECVFFHLEEFYCGEKGSTHTQHRHYKLLFITTGWWSLAWRTTACQAGCAEIHTKFSFIELKMWGKNVLAFWQTTTLTTCWLKKSKEREGAKVMAPHVARGPVRLIVTLTVWAYSHAGDAVRGKKALKLYCGEPSRNSDVLLYIL